MIFGVNCWVASSPLVKTEETSLDRNYHEHVTINRRLGDELKKKPRKQLNLASYDMENTTTSSSTK